MISQTLPSDPSLKTIQLGQCFKNTTTAYKFYWFLGLLDAVVEGKTDIDAEDIACRMICSVWYPVHYFRLSFGAQDQLFKTVQDLQKNLNISIQKKESELFELLKQHAESDKETIRNISKFLRFVPYRFLSPWIKAQSDAAVIQASENFSANGALYLLYKEQGRLKVRVHPQWVPYLKNNYEILRSFALWSLTNYVQARNPNVPNISSKLLRPENRASLARQTQFWNAVMQAGLPVKSIYTGEELRQKNFALDHFIPWSFVTHDLLWNLTPIESTINSSKSDRLPNLQVFLKPLVEQHKQAVNCFLETGGSTKLLEDYSSLGLTAVDVSRKPVDDLVEKFAETFVPLEQIARNMGFEPWNYNGLV